MTEIPQIVEDLYEQLVIIPDQKDWPDYLCGNPAEIGRASCRERV